MDAPARRSSAHEVGAAEPLVVILCGVPGSGKSTFASRLQVFGCEVISQVEQDALGSLQKCEKEFAHSLRKGRNVVVDWYNINSEQRRVWLDTVWGVTGGRATTVAVQLRLPLDLCKHRARQRPNHPNLDARHNDHVIDSVARDWEDILPEENFTHIYVARSEEECEELARHIARMLGSVHGSSQSRPQSGAFTAPTFDGDEIMMHPAQQSMPWRQPRPMPPPPSHASSLSWHRQAPVTGPPPPGARPMHGAPFNFTQAREYAALPPGFGLEPQAQSHWRAHNNVHHAPPPPRPPAQPPSLPRAVSEGSQPSTRHHGDVQPPFSSPQHSSKQQNAPAQLHLDLEPHDDRIILLFDLNGTLTSHTSKRKSSGRNRLRPGTAELVRLAERFRVGIFTSSTARTVATVREMLEGAAGGNFLDDRLILFRDHTAPAPKAHVAKGGDPWDTIKPLHRWFSRLHRVLLFDDDSYKSVPGEEGNMVLVPCWMDEDEEDGLLPALVDTVLQVLGALGPDDDVRQYSRRMSEQLAAACKQTTGAGDEVMAAPEQPPSNCPVQHGASLEL